MTKVYLSTYFRMSTHPTDVRLGTISKPAELIPEVNLSWLGDKERLDLLSVLHRVLSNQAVCVVSGG